MKAATKAVVTLSATTTTTTVYSREIVVSTARRAFTLEGESQNCKKAVMEMLAAEFGVHTITPHNNGAGGINCGCFKATSSVDTMKEEASRLGLTLVKARDLAETIGEIRQIGARVWQECQRIAFGRKETTEATPVTSLASDVLALATLEKEETKTSLAIARAQLSLAKATKGDIALAQSTFDVANQNAIIAKEGFDHARHVVKAEKMEISTTRAIESLSDAIQIAIDLARKQGRNALADKLEAILLMV